jgi:hypothetical protein
MEAAQVLFALAWGGLIALALKPEWWVRFRTRPRHPGWVKKPELTEPEGDDHPNKLDRHV